MIEQNQRYVELDAMKFWGILLVVLGHVTNMFTMSGLYSWIHPSEELSLVSSLIYSFHMPLFVFVSGCVYAYQCEVLNKKLTFVQLISKKAVRLLIPYVFWGFFIMVPLMCYCELRPNVWEYASQGIFLSKDCRHLWFVLMLFLVFVLFWCINKLSEILKFPKWCVLPASFFMYFFANIVPYVFQLSNAFRYLFWFSLGYSFLIYNGAVHKFVVNYISGGVILFMYVALNTQLSIKIPFLATIVAMAGIMLFYHISCDWKNLVKYSFFQVINRNSFGIYLYHVIFIYLLFYWMKGVSLSPYLMCIIVFVASLFLSIFMTELTRMARLQILIGEKRYRGK